MILRRRLVRLHQLDPAPSIEGVLVGFVAGHYRLLKPVLLESPERSHSMGVEAWVPRERVIFVERVA